MVGEPRRAACVLGALVACAPAAAPPLGNHVGAEPAHHCEDRQSTAEGMTYYVSSDDRDPGPVDDSFDATWKRLQPRFERCRSANASPEPRSVMLEFHVSRAGDVIDARTLGPDPAVDRCACAVLFGLTFPAQSPPVFAVLAVEVPPRVPQPR